MDRVEWFILFWLFICLVVWLIELYGLANIGEHYRWLFTLRSFTLSTWHMLLMSCSVLCMYCMIKQQRCHADVSLLRPVVWLVSVAAIQAAVDDLLFARKVAPEEDLRAPTVVCKRVLSLPSAVCVIAGQTGRNLMWEPRLNTTLYNPLVWNRSIFSRKVWWTRSP